MEKAILNESRDNAALWIQNSSSQGFVEALFWLRYKVLGKEQTVFDFKKVSEKGYTEAYNCLLNMFLFSAAASANIEEAKKNISCYSKDHRLFFL